ncbi:MAG: DHA2 family efflux MFS transporter permease subunit [Novosphingobium sp.]|nr:DHA2 family efflux MFS transporter permease subunit [Novosphingobium sp.]
MVLALSNFMVVLDLTIANVSIPHIAGNLGISLDQGTWVITSYAVAEAICVPLTGWLAQRFGVVKMFMGAMIGFGAFSLLCGSSLSLGMLVVCRIGQGLCGGPIMPMSQTLMSRVVPPEGRGRAMGVWAMTTTAAPAIGPILGGYISDNWSWHWIFLINVPIAAGCTAAAFALLRPAETLTRKVPIDKVGLALLVFWIGCLQVMLDIGRDRDWFGDAMILVLALLAGIGFTAFIIWELTDDHPVVDLRVFRYPAFSFGVATMALVFGAFFSSVVLVPQFLQTSLGYSAAKAGFITALSAVSSVMAAPFAARFMSRMDARILISAGVVWLGLMALMRAGWTSGTDSFHLALPLALQGFAMPFMLIPITSASLAAVQPQETASAAGLQNFVRTMAVAISTSVVLTIWADSQRVARSEIVSKLQPDGAMAQLSRLGMGADQSRQILSNIVEQEAVALAVDHAFLLTALLMFGAATLVWLMPRPKIPGGPVATH